MNKDVATSAEPWVLLPFWAMRSSSSARAVYSHHTASNALNDFLDGIPNGDSCFESSMRAFGETMYNCAAGGKPYFLDKTPRYYLMIPLIKKVFPESKIILLMRNPLAVLVSICETFHKGRFWWLDYWLDWELGHSCLAKAVNEGGEQVKVVRYEDLVTDTRKVMEELCSWLSIGLDDEMLTAYRGLVVKGRMGDPVGVHKYSQVSAESIDKWRHFFYSRYRRMIACRMLDRISEGTLSTLGYPRRNLVHMLEEEPVEIMIDLKSRFERVIGAVASSLDYRYLQARIGARKGRSRFVAGYYVPGSRR